MARHKDIIWEVPAKPENWEQVNTVLLMDIRDAVKEMTRELRTITQCRRFIGIPNALNRIERNTERTKRTKRTKLARA